MIGLYLWSYSGYLHNLNVDVFVWFIKMKNVQVGVMKNTHLTKKVLLERYRCYGFIECGAILRFLEFVCESQLGYCEFVYIMEKTRECILRNDNGSDYFSDLRNMIYEINCILHMYMK